MSRVLVLGGYGAVGAVTTRALAEAYPGSVVCAGRRADRAASTAAVIPGVRAATVDVTDPGSMADALDRHRPALVVLAVEPPDSEATRQCLERGIHVVDVSATAALLEQTERMGELARERGAAAVLSVGLAPGLTNLLARRVHDELGGADQLDITLLIGSGERHGADGIRWTVRQLAGPRRQVDAQPLTVELPGLGRRRAHPFPFSDQFTLRRTLPAAAGVTTRLCLDSRAVTTLLFGAQRSGAFRIVRGRRAVEVVTKALQRIHVGGDGFAVRVDGRRGDQESWQAITGSRQSRTTGLVAARVARAVLEDRVPRGVHHVDEVDHFLHVPEQLAEVAGLRMWHGPATDTYDGLDLKST